MLLGESVYDMLMSCREVIYELIPELRIEDSYIMKKYPDITLWEHTVKAVSMSKNLCERLCMLLHDVAKEIPALELAAIVSKSSLDVCDIEKKAVPLFHGIAGAELVQTLFDIHDPEIISAIRYHTVACGNMPKLSQIVYLADLISADRDYKDVKKMRKYAEQSLEKAMFEALKFSIKDSVDKGNTIPVSTLEAYNDFADNSK